MSTHKKVSGSCFCEAVHFSIDLPTLFCGHCHCSMCRRSHGAGFVTWFRVQHDQFSLDAAEAEPVRFASSDHGTRRFCSRCGSTLFYESTRHLSHIDIVPANMEIPIDRAPQAHFYFDDRTDWSSVDDGLPRLGGPTGTSPLRTPDESD